MASCTSRVLCFSAIINTLPDFKGKQDLLSTLDQLREQSDFAEVFGHPANPDLERKFFTDPRFHKERDLYLEFENEMSVIINKLAKVLATFNNEIEQALTAQLEDLNAPKVLLTPEQAVQTGINIANKVLAKEESEE